MFVFNIAVSGSYKSSNLFDDGKSSTFFDDGKSSTFFDDDIIHF